MRPYLPLVTLGLLAACADSEPPEAVQVGEDGVYNVVDPVKAPLADEGQPAIGQWIQSMQEERPALQFGPANTEPLFSMRCDDRDGLLLQRHGVVQAGTAQMMTLTTAGSSQQLAVNPVAGALPVLRAAVPSSDPLMQRLTEVNDPIRVEIGDEPPLILPASPMIGEFVANCANPAAPAATPANSSVATNSAE